MSTGDNEQKKVAKAFIGLVIAALVACLPGIAGVKAFTRWQTRQDATNAAAVARITADNESAVNTLRIKAQEQKVQITKQDAEIRKQEAIGIKEAQDTISATLTPLYVQMEMVRTLEAIAKDGKNATIIYIPVDPSTGIPLVKSIHGEN